MKSKRRQRRMFVHLLTVITALTANSAYPSRLVSGNLGNWLQQEAAPRLGEILERHPRFKGERIRITGMQNGHPRPLGEKLSERIRTQLTQDLLASTNVQIVFDDYQHCRPVEVNTVLGIEIEKHDLRNHRVTLAMVDVEEGIWLNGTNLGWNGRLTGDQLREFSVPSQPHAEADFFTVNQTAEIAASLNRKLRCHGPIAAPVFFETADSELGRGVLRRVREHISSKSLVTAGRQDAVSIIALRFADTDAAMRELVLELSSADDPPGAHRIAAVMVAVPRPPATAATPARPVRGEVEYLSAIRIVDDHSGDGICDDGRGGCVEVGFELHRPAYVVLFHTRDSVPAPLTCARPRLRAPGELRFRLNVAQGVSADRPAVGFYALAFNDRSAAAAVQRSLKRGSESCSERALPLDEWIVSFGRTLRTYRGETHWRTLYLNREGDGVSTL